VIKNSTHRKKAPLYKTFKYFFYFSYIKLGVGKMTNDERMLKEKRKQRTNSWSETELRNMQFLTYDTEILKNKDKEPTFEGNSYSDGKGKYCETDKMLFSNLVPPNGEANTKYGELLRRISRGYYRLYNDGDTVQVSKIVEVDGISLEPEIKKNMKHPSNYDYLLKIEYSTSPFHAPGTNKYRNAVEDFTDGTILTTYYAYKNGTNTPRKVSDD
jgi:hypothetical protein